MDYVERTIWAVACLFCMLIGGGIGNAGVCNGWSHDAGRE